MSRRILLPFVGLAIVVAAILLATSWPDPEDAPPVDPARGHEGDDPELRGAAQPIPPPTEPAPIDRGVAVVGRVWDGATHRGLADVRVLASCAGRKPWEVTTGRQGTFQLSFGPRPDVLVDLLLRAVSRGGRGVDVVVRIAPTGGHVEDVGTLLLRPTRELIVRVVHQGKPVAGASVHVASRARRLGRGVGTRWGPRWRGYPYRAVTDAAGLARLEGVPRGVLALLALAAGPLRGECVLDPAGADAPIELELRTARDLRVQVVWEDSGAPVPGCTVVPTAGVGQLPEPAPAPRTDAAGAVVLRNLSDDVPISVSVTGPPSRPVHWSDASRTARPGDRALRVELRSPLTLRFPIVVEDGAFPPDGMRVPLDHGGFGRERGIGVGMAGEAIVDGRDLVVEVYRQFHERGTARLPDGRVGAVLVRGDLDVATRRSHVRRPLDPVVFRSPRSVRVEVVERGTGKPAVGVSVRLSVRAGPRRIAPVRTDAAGAVTFHGLPAGTGWVAVCPNPSWVPANRQGTASQRIDIDLSEGGATVRFDVHAIDEGVLRVTTQGHPGFPRGLQVDLWSRPEGGVWVSPPGLVYDAQASEIRFPWRRFVVEPTPPARAVDDPGSLALRITSDTHATERLRVEAGEGLDASVDLLPAASLLVRVLKPEGTSFRPALERHGESGRWAHVPAAAAIAVAGDEAGDLYAHLRPGRYRLHDRGTGLVSDAIDVRVGPEPSRLVWDATQVGFAEGEVILPAGIDPVGLSVFVMEGERRQRVVGGAQVTDGYRFRVLVPGDRPVWLRPVHGSCIPDPKQERIVLTGPRTGIRLRMVEIER